MREKETKMAEYRILFVCMGTIAVGRRRVPYSIRQPLMGGHPRE